MNIKQSLLFDGVDKFKRKTKKDKTDLIRLLLAEIRNESNLLNGRRRELVRKINKKQDIAQEVLDILSEKDFEKFEIYFQKYLK